MEPLSAAASAIALVQATVSIAKGVRFLRSLGQIPTEYAELLNELSTLQAVTEKVGSALTELNTPQSTGGPAKALQNIDTSVLVSLKNDLAQVVEDLHTLCDQLKPSRNSNEKTSSLKETSVSKIKWHKEKENIQRLQRKASRSRELLGVCLSALISTQTQRHVGLTLEIHQILFKTADGISELESKNALTRGEHTEILEGIRKSIDQLNESLTDRGSSSSTKHSATALTTVDFQASIVQGCLATCNCRCHQNNISHSPDWLGASIGSLFMRYNTNALLQRPACNKSTCAATRPTSVRLYYAFPRWLLARAVDVSVSWSSLTGPGSSLHVRVPRVLEGGAIWRAIQFGDLRWIRIHIANKSILPSDVDRWGQSLAQVALHRNRFELAGFFVQQGCDIHSEDIYGRTAASVARNLKLTYGRSLTTNGSKHLLHELSLRHKIKGPVRSSIIHEAIIRCESQSSIYSFIEAHKDEVDSLDADGLAPLHWAVRMNEADTVRALLEAGADPNRKSAKGSGLTPLMFAAAWNITTDVGRLLLEFGAGPNTPSTDGHYTAISLAFDNPPVLRLLLDHGAHVQVKTSQGESLSPLLRAARSYIDFARNDEQRALWKDSLHLLMSAGLDINTQSDSSGTAPVSFCLWNRNAILLEVLLDAGARVDLVDSVQNGVLHYAALSTTAESVQILRRANLSGINPDLPNKDGETPLGWLASRYYTSDDDLAAGEHRITADEFWAFKLLIDEIRGRNDEKRRFGRTMAGERVHEVDASSDCASDDVDSMAAWGGGSQGSGGHGILRAMSTGSGCDEFFDVEESNE